MNLSSFISCIPVFGEVNRTYKRKEVVRMHAVVDLDIIRGYTLNVIENFSLPSNRPNIIFKTHQEHNV